MRRLIILLTVPLILACGIQSAAMSADVLITPSDINTRTPMAQNSELAEPLETPMATKTPPPACTAVVTAERLNLRAANSETSPADYDGLVMGDVLEVKVIADGWLFVFAADGRSGWVKAEFVQVDCD